MESVFYEYRVKILYLFSAVGIGSTLAFGIIPYLLQGNYTYALYEIFLTSVVVLNLIVFNKTRNYNLAASVILACVFAVLIFLVITGGLGGTGIFWIYTFPILAFYLKSVKRAFVWSLSLLGSIVGLLVADLSSILDIYYDTITIRQAGGVYLAVTLLATFYRKLIDRVVFSFRDRAITDGLTGLYNRAFIMETLNNFLKALDRRSEDRYCVAYIDLDGFKRVNDQFGHSRGDKVLIKFSQIMREFFRESDIVGRVGGDEFLIIFPHCDKKRVEERLKLLREKVEKEFFIYGLSMSYGVVEIPTERDSIDEVINVADAKMYEMKVRNRTA